MCKFDTLVEKKQEKRDYKNFIKSLTSGMYCPFLGRQKRRKLVKANQKHKFALKTIIKMNRKML